MTTDLSGAKARSYKGRKFSFGNGPLATVRRINSYFDNVDSIASSLADLVSLFDQIKFKEYSPENDEYIVEETKICMKPSDTLTGVKDAFKLLNVTLRESGATTRFSKREGAIFLIDHLLTCRSPNFPTLMGMLNMRKKQKYRKDVPVNKPSNCIRLQPEPSNNKRLPSKDLRTIKAEVGPLPLIWTIDILPKSISKKEDGTEVTMLPARLNRPARNRRRNPNAPLKQIPDKANHQRKRVSGEKAAEKISNIHKSKRVKLKKLKLPVGISSRKFKQMKKCTVVLHPLNPEKYKDLLMK
ncbi:unnamed protein product [Oikopleura dioica]|uniref:Uncharacterized protein n=1 Tax=Oikopleura dioica TaxID=34765 RepID=E4XGF2_OIKDI|nr:unnamed protein product [Oikopleura dioica]